MLDGIKPGWLLVASPRLQDPNFRRTVVFVIAHNAEGTVGVVLNRPSETAVHTVLPAWSSHVTRPQAVFAGGPVQTSAAMALGVLERGESAPPLGETSEDGRLMERISGPVVLVNLDSEPADVQGALRGLRVYVGHAGWGADQLADEVAEGAWFVLPGLPEDVMAGPMTDLWFKVMRRQPWPLTIAAYHPGDLSRN